MLQDKTILTRWCNDSTKVWCFISSLNFKMLLISPLKYGYLDKVRQEIDNHFIILSKLEASCQNYIFIIVKISPNTNPHSWLMNHFKILFILFCQPAMTNHKRLFEYTFYEQNINISLWFHVCTKTGHLSHLIAGIFDTCNHNNQKFTISTISRYSPLSSSLVANW